MGLYLIAILPNDQIAEEVWEWKRKFAEVYHSSHGLKVMPHITLKMPFNFKEDQINGLIKQLIEFGKSQEPFDVELNGFGYFSGKKSDVVYINPLSNPLLNQLHVNLIHFLKETELPKLEDSNKFHPHLTIAHRDLKRDQRKKAWVEFENQPYQRNFEVKSFYLLRHEGKRWCRFAEIPIS